MTVHALSLFSYFLQRVSNGKVSLLATWNNYLQLRMDNFFDIEIKLAFRGNFFLYNDEKNCLKQPFRGEQYIFL